MAALVSFSEEFYEEDIVARAAGEGFRLVQSEMPHGQLVWEWRRRNEPRPQFVSRRVAVSWMNDWLKGGAGSQRSTEGL